MKTIDIIKDMLSEDMSISTQPINEQLGKFFTDVAVKATVDAAKLELKNLVSTIVNSGKGLTKSAIVGSRVYLETLEKLSQAAAKQAGHKNWAAFVKADPAGAKIAMTEVTKGMNEELLGAAKGMNKPIEGGLGVVKNDAKAVTNKIGKSTPAEIDAALVNVQSNSKLSTNLQKARGEITKLKPQTLKQFETSMAKLAKMRQGNGAQIGGGLKNPVTGVKGGKAYVFKPADLLKYPGQVVHYTFSGAGLKTILGIVGGAAILYAIYQMLNPDALVIVTDENGKDVQDGGLNSWAPCIQELLTSKEGVISQTSNGQISVVVKPTDFPGGLQFYNNGRVMDVVGKKMGTWKCKGTKAVIAETQKIKLGGLLNEQGDATTADDVSTMIDLLDFPVSGSDLKTAGNLLQKYVDNGKGKDFLSLYQQSGLGGGDLTKTLNYIITTEPTSVQAKNRLKQLNAQILSGKGGQTKQNTGDKKGLGGIDIIWDNQKKSDGKVVNPIKKSRYHDCSGKDTFEFGCKSPKIKEIQKCLGMEERYLTGNFGPLTKKALEDMSYDTSKGITVEMYNRIKSTCTDDSNKPRLDGSTVPLKTNLTPKMAPVNTDNLKMPTIQPVGQGNKGESIYNGLKNNFNDKTLPYIFTSGGRIKYKGDEIGVESLGLLDQYIETLGYQRIKEKDKDYGVKYVWAKQ
jgi:hypothetical protein